MLVLITEQIRLEKIVASRLRFKVWLNDEQGATAIEYSFISAAMALALVPALGSTTSGIAGLYTSITELFDF